MKKRDGNKKGLTPAQQEALWRTLQQRFEQHPARHRGVAWAAVRKRLEASPEKSWSLSEMERTGGEPDVISLDRASGEAVFCDCSAESPTGRRSLCYDGAALKSRKENKPKGSALDLAAAMGLEVLDEDGYRELQQLGAFDTKTSSWLKTPAPIRQLGGALFGDCRFGRVFTYHNGAESYYAARGFRGVLRV